MKWDIDINCDLGEGAGNDAKILPLIDSCSIACGGHYGTNETIQTTVNLAKKHTVKIGAHPSFPDPTNFGRVVIQMEAEALKDALVEQVMRLKNIALESGIVMSHVKLHGALYNLAAKDAAIANIVVKALLNVGTDFAIYTPTASQLYLAAQQHYTIIPEVFIDRTYQKNGSLTPRSTKGALIEDAQQAWTQIERIYSTHTVSTISNEIIPINGDTYCIHGDSDHCLNLLEYINNKLNRV